MTDEEKKVAALEAERQAKADESDEDDEAEEEESADDESAEEESEDDDESTQNLDTDYEKELELERSKREKAEQALAEKRFKAATERRKGGDAAEDETDADEDDGEKPLSLSENRLRAILAEERQATRKEMEAGRITDLATARSTSPAEAALIVEIHKNRTFPSWMPLEDQVDEAYVIANRKRIIGQRDEAMRAARGKDGVNRFGAGGSHKPQKPGAEPKTTSQDLKALKDAGFKWNGTTRRMEKLLPNGSTVAQDPKTKQTIIIPKK